MRGLGTLIADTLTRPVEAAELSIGEWSILIRQARVAEMLGQLRARLADAGVLDVAPLQARRHLDVAWQLSLRHREAVRSEVIHVRNALESLSVPVVLLKGAAYCIAGNRAAVGRVFNDVDILVPRAALDAVEHALMRNQWLPAPVDAYDQKYYRDWTHELPPMEHKTRGTVLDVHHTIVPPVSGIVPDPDALMRSACRVEDPELRMFSIFAPEDRVIHSAAHLFMGEFHKGLRDLYDLHTLFDEFGVEEAFWERLVSRALECGLALPLLDSMIESRRLFQTAVPERALLQLAEHFGHHPFQNMKTWLYDCVLRPNHPSCNGPFSRAARWLAFARSHWLRMPIPLLVYHLGYKALKGKR